MISPACGGLPSVFVVVCRHRWTEYFNNLWSGLCLVACVSLEIKFQWFSLQKKKQNEILKLDLFAQLSNQGSRMNAYLGQGNSGNKK